MRHHQRFYGVDRLPEEETRRGRAGYYGCVSFVDDHVAQVLQALDELGLRDDTLVVYVSDHGEMFGEHGLIAHGFSVAEPLIHVPLVLAGPGAERAPDHAFSHAALPALIADACGLRDHPWSETDVPERIAISYYDAIGAPEHPQIQAFASRWGLDDDAVARLTASYASATDGVHKLVRRDTTELRYDLGADPGERAPLGDAVDERFAPLRAALDRASAAGEIEVPAAEAATSALEDDEVAELERQMRMLGYM
jgi:arylsulfatase A-like enzyme